MSDCEGAVWEFGQIWSKIGTFRIHFSNFIAFFLEFAILKNVKWRPLICVQFFSPPLHSLTFRNTSIFLFFFDFLFLNLKSTFGLENILDLLYMSIKIQIVNPFSYHITWILIRLDTKLSLKIFVFLCCYVQPGSTKKSYGDESNRNISWKIVLFEKMWSILWNARFGLKRNVSHYLLKL